ncbi:MAG TPA: SGNH/GDSL hydrolase family protein [Alphaproteobacteria bacterium]|nr:SGNH/GDSL hydrolase family protein [Alphaproteobacteria bacterium]
MDVTPGVSRGRRALARRPLLVTLFGGVGAALVLFGPLAAVAEDAVSVRLAAEAWRCEVPAHLLESPFALPRVAHRLSLAEPLKIVAIGSSSTAGAGASSPSATYPARLQAELARLFPGSPIAVVNKGVGGESAKQMVARFQRDVVQQNPDLVIWQTGTNSALRRGSYEELVDNLGAGIAIARRANIDIVLMGPQKAPAFDAVPGHGARIEQVAAIAKTNGAPFFDRYAAMQHWHASGQIALGAAIDRDGLHMTDQSYYCVGRLLGRMIANLAAAKLAVSR